MSEPSPEFSDLVVETVPTPDFAASADPGELPPVEPTTRRRRILGQPGSKDTASRATRNRAAKADAKADAAAKLPPIPRGGFIQPVEKMYGFIAMGLMPIDMGLGMAVAECAHNAAVAWDELARRNDAVRRMLTAMMQTTAAGALLAAHMPLVLAIMAKTMGNDPRLGALGNLLGNQAEEYANGANGYPTEGDQAA